jgi:uncharacterized CHY-type Zn-finger protein
LYLGENVTYNCKDCKFFNASGAATQSTGNKTIDQAQQNNVSGRNVKGGVCTKLNSNRQANAEANCSVVWGDVENPATNPFWEANKDVVDKAKKMLTSV